MFQKLLIAIITLTVLLNFTIDSGNKTSVFISEFKNGADGAYTIIHDDFGGSWASGIEDYADSIAYNRGIPFCFAVITGHCDDNDWKNANRMLSHGHQILNHSMNHKCGSKTAGCSADFETWNEDNFNLEIDSSMEQIQKFTGKHPAFFMFPFDVHTDTMISYLKYKGYAGARAGKRDELVKKENIDPFYLNFKAYMPDQTQEDLNSFANEAVKNGSWAIREVHGVNDGSWGSIPLEDYRGHIMFIKMLQDSGKLWVATLSDILKYKNLKDMHNVTLTHNIKDGLSNIKFRKNNTYNSDQKIFKALSGSSDLQKLTIVIENQEKEILCIHQKNSPIPYLKKENKLLFDADPLGGEVVIHWK